MTNFIFDLRDGFHSIHPSFQTQGKALRFGTPLGEGEMEFEEKQPAVYIVASRYRGTIYTGVTSNLYDRISAHKEKLFQGFTADYGCNVLVWYENHETMPTAIKRETQLKAWKRQWKIELIEGFNRHWLDLHEQIAYRPYEWEKRGPKSPAKGGRLE